MEFQQRIAFLKQQFLKPLPGREAQYLMAPETRLTEEKHLELFPEFKVSCVLFLLYPSANKTMLVLIERGGSTGIHSGQIALPGGKHETSDASLQATALREAEEETGIQTKDVCVIGQLTDLFITASKFKVFPFVGYLNYRPDFVANEAEVKSIIETDIEILLNDEIKRKKEFVTIYGRLPAPYFKYDQYEIWGATAMMISEFAQLFK